MINKEILTLLKKADPDDPLDFIHNIAKDYAREKLDQYILNCNDCEFSSSIKSPTFGSTNAEILVISGIVTSEQKNNTVFPLEGTLGEDIFNRALKNAGIEKNSLFLINAVNCLLPDAIPNKKEVKNCRIFIDYAIEIVKPKRILLLGNTSVGSFLKVSLNKVRGSWIEIKGVPAIATYHPDYFIKMQEFKSPGIIEEIEALFCEDIKKLKEEKS